jgi:predicted RNA methylase
MSISPRTYGDYDETNPNQVYGEICPEDFIMLLKESPVSVESIMDVGSGCGRALVAAVQQIPSLKYAIGVENNRYRFEKSQELVGEWCDKIELICDDFQNVSFRQAEMIQNFESLINSKMKVAYHCSSRRDNKYRSRR